MKVRFNIVVAALFVCFPSWAQTKSHKLTKGVQEPETAEWVRNYMDSLSAVRAHIDCCYYAAKDIRYSPPFTPLTFYPPPANHFLRLNPAGCSASLDCTLDKSLLFIDLNRPDLVIGNESRLDVGCAPIPEGAPRKTEVDIVEEVAPKAIELEASPMKIYVAKPNFWTVRGDYYLQFLQNYVSDNWYKGGESNYSMLGSVRMQAN